MRVSLPAQVLSPSPARVPADQVPHKPAHSGLSPRPALKVSVRRVVIEGFGQVSPARFREGFREEWQDQGSELHLNGAEQRLPRAFRQQLSLTHFPSSSASLGRAVARAMMTRLAQVSNR